MDTTERGETKVGSGHQAPRLRRVRAALQMFLFLSGAELWAVSRVVAQFSKAAFTHL